MNLQINKLATIKVQKKLENTKYMVIFAIKLIIRKIYTIKIISYDQVVYYN